MIEPAASVPNLAIKPPYDPNRDFIPITEATAAPYLLVVYPGVEAKSLKELIALAKARPGKFNYASGGIGHKTRVTRDWRLVH